MAPKLKLTYFNIEGAAEKVRLALKIGGIEFQDDRVDFPAWATLKPTTPFGQLPLLSIDDGPPITQSYAMLHYAGKLGGLYPEDPIKALKVDEVLGLLDDLAKVFAPSFYITRSPQNFGHPSDMPEPERLAIQAKLRAAMIAEGGDLHRFLGYFDNILKKNGSGFFVGDSVTIADCAVLPQIRSLQSGRLDGIPVSVLEGYPNILTFVEKMNALPAVKAHYAK